MGRARDTDIMKLNASAVYQNDFKIKGSGQVREYGQTVMMWLTTNGPVNSERHPRSLEASMRHPGGIPRHHRGIPRYPRGILRLEASWRHPEASTQGRVYG